MLTTSKGRDHVYRNTEFGGKGSCCFGEGLVA